MSANEHGERDEPAIAPSQAVEGNTIGRDLTQVIVNLPNADLDLSLLERLRASCAQPQPAADPSAKIVFKGLRSFDEQDAGFYLSLLPGPFDTEGLPESIRFWKNRIGQADPDRTFRVGVLYGPSGCGKSSLLRAGVLPRLAGSVVPVVVEATAADTEGRMLAALRRQCPFLPPKSSLTATLRKKKSVPAGKKVLIVIDQFEQWLHAHPDHDRTELVEALRACDGEFVQCLVVVRDDFWMPVSRFFKSLKVEIEGGKNAGMVDLFDLDHAKKVLAGAGRAFDKLNPEPLSAQETAFLDEAVGGLAQDGRVICVRLVLLIQLFKDREWTPAALREVGGTEGVGAAFLEETFSARAASPRYRTHQVAARSILDALLPEPGMDIRGHMRSSAELLEASGYGDRPQDFDDLVRILDSELRLITPTNHEGKAGGDAPTPQPGPGGRYYQLTHDYLVPSLRDWLTRKQKETPEGRADLSLEEWGSLWNTGKEYRPLPSFSQWIDILSYTQEKNWTEQQRQMMEAAGAHHVKLVWDRILAADTRHVPTILAEIEPYLLVIGDLLRSASLSEGASQDTRKRLHASLAVLKVDRTQVKYLHDRMLDATQHELPVIRDALAQYKDELRDELWMVVCKPEKGKESQRLRAASALAEYDPASHRWAEAGPLVVNDLVQENPIFLGQWSKAFRRVKNRLHPQLVATFRDRRPERTAERSLATNLLADYNSDEPSVLADLLMDADEKQFPVIFARFKDGGDQGLSELIGEIEKKLPPGLPSSDEEREKLAQRQANAAVALLRLKQPSKVWALFQGGPDPRVRSYLIHWLSLLGADPRAVVMRLEEEADVTIRRALILSLGEFGETEFPPDDRTTFLPKLHGLYQTASDPGLHSATEWLLRRWKQEAWLEQVNEEWVKNREQREERLGGIGKALVNNNEETPPQWYVTGQGQTMVVIPGPVEFVMGSPLSEEGRGDDEIQHKRRIGRTFAIAAQSVTWSQYLKYAPQDANERDDRYSPSLNCPANYISWTMAAGYCNWLSEVEGFAPNEWCYEITGNGTRLKRNYLSLTGYRLPTEAEMEYATRAGAVTSRHFGESEQLLCKYAWYLKNAQERSWPVGKLKPNDLGLFDVPGNVFSWCQESYRDYPTGESEEATDDQEDRVLEINTSNRVLRGGSFLVRPSSARSAYRSSYGPADRYSYGGFRLARTFTA